MLNKGTSQKSFGDVRLGWKICCLGALLLLLTACGAAEAPPKQVLLLHSFGREFAPFNTFSETFRTELGQQLGDRVEFHDVALESARLEGEASEGPLVEYLTTLFAPHRLDLVVTIGGPAARFAQKYRQRLFAATPLLIAAVDQRHLQPLALTTNDAVVAVANDPLRVLDNLLQVLPQTTNVAVVLGSSPLEKFWAGELRRQLQPFTNRVAFTWLDDLSFAQLLKRVALLPPRSAIYYAFFSVDAEGVPCVEERALRRLHEAATAPMFGVHDTQLGRGIVGGPLLAIDELSRNAAKVAVRLLQGEPPASIQTPVQTLGRPTYDWRELRRWGIRETRLPAGSVMRFRQASLWEMHQGRIIAIIGLCLLEALIIALLVLNRVKRRRVEQLLREGEERLSLAATAARMGLWEWDLSQDRIWATENWRQLFGFKPDEALSPAKTFQRVHPQDRAAVERDLRQAIASHSAYTGEYRVVLPDQTERWVITRGRLHAEAKGKPARMMGASVETTERKRAIESLRRLQQQNELLLTSAAEGILGLDLDGNHTFVNPAAARMLGYSAEELLRRHSHATWHHTKPDGRPYPVKECPVCAVFRDGLVRRVFGEVFWRKDGTSFPVEYAGTPIYQQGRLVGAVVTFEDVTERRAAEQALLQSEERLRLVLEANSEGVWDWNIPSGKAYFSRHYSGMLGYAPQEFAKDYDAWKALVHPDDFERVNAAHAAHIHEGKEFCVELRMRKKSGHWCWVRSRGTVVERDAEGRAIRMVGTHQDITNAKQAEQEMQRQREELAHVSRVSVMGELAASVAHELNQPLGAILSNAEAAEMFLAQDPPALNELRDILADIRKDDERAGEVIRRMRALLRKGELERQPLQLNLLVEDVFTLVAANAALRTTSIRAELTPDLPLVSGDRIQLQQVLLNLIMNALEAMTKQPPEKRRLLVRTHHNGDSTIQVLVADSGPGIDAAHLPRLFDPFFTTKPNGIGMGLAISRKIVEAHAGRIWAENRTGGGAVFHLTLPGVSAGKQGAVINDQ
jgi:PAS domain S-box-containing protein